MSCFGIIARINQMRQMPWVSFTLIPLIRSVFRTMENYQRFYGYFLVHEAYFRVYDALPLTIATRIFIASWPELYLANAAVKNRAVAMHTMEWKRRSMVSSFYHRRFFCLIKGNAEGFTLAMNANIVLGDILLNIYQYVRRHKSETASHV